MKKMILSSILSLSLVASCSITAFANTNARGSVSASWKVYTSGGIVDGSQTGAYHSLNKGTARLRVSSTTASSSNRLYASLLRSRVGPDLICGNTSFTGTGTHSIGRADTNSSKYYLQLWGGPSGSIQRVSGSLTN